MRQIFLLRHATARAAMNGERDFERPLSAQGQAEAKSLSHMLARKGYVADLILCSPAKRTQETSAEIRAAMPDALIELQQDLYEASLDELLAILRGINDDIKRVMIVGHNPTIAALALFLGTYDQQTRNKLFDFAPCSFCILTTTSQWSHLQQHSARVVELLHPSGANN